jgi:glycosyltransferase involved in cell wall biosynthesis
LYVHLPAHLDEETYRQRWQNGLEPDASPYGFHHARSLGYTVAFSKRHNPNGLLGRFFGRITNRFSFGLDVNHAWHNRKAINSADIVWTMLEQEALAVSLLMRVGALKSKPIIGGTVWVINQWASLPKQKRLAFRYLMQKWAVIAVHTRTCLSAAVKIFDKGNPQFLAFGISADTFSTLPPPTPEKRAITIFAMGNDRTRDWDILFRAFGNDERFQIRLVCRWVNAEDISRFANVELIREPSIEKMRQLYADADYAAVTMHKNIFSGITVALEAAALGVPILGTKTGGLLTYFSNNEMLLSEVANDMALRTAVLEQSNSSRRSMADRARTKFLHQEYTTLGMIKRYDKLSRPFL